jgi:hypothetical protein
MEAGRMNAFFALVTRDLRLAFRRKAEVLSGVFFFVVVAALFPLAIGPEAATLRHIGPGVLWVGALLASMRMPQFSAVGSTRSRLVTRETCTSLLTSPAWIRRRRSPWHFA